MKDLLLLLLSGLVIAGCCSTRNDLQHLSTSDLQLRRYELMYCLSTNRTSRDKQVVQSDTHDEVNADLQEKAAIEGEIARRDVTAYHSPHSLSNGYEHDRCHCEDWVVHVWDR